MMMLKILNDLIFDVLDLEKIDLNLEGIDLDLEASDLS